MNRNVSVVEDGVERAPAPQFEGPSWFWVTVGFVVGLGTAIVFFTAGSDEPVDPAQAAATPEVAEPAPVDNTTATTAQKREGVGEVVPGFPDTLIAVTQTSGGNMGYLTWPVAGPPHSDDLPGFLSTKAEFDASGRMLALGASVPDTDRMLLSVGTAARVQLLATDVTGFAWHGAERGHLAFSQVVDGQWTLWLADTSRELEEVTISSELSGAVAAWGDWGFAIQGENTVTLLSVEGEIRQTLQGRVLAADRDGRIVLYDGSLRLVTENPDVQPLDIDLSGIGEPEVASISPDGSKLAVVGGAGHLILPIDGDGDVTYAPVTSGFPQLAWSSDSRFLISPWIRGVLFIDTERSSAQPLAELTRETVVAVTAVQLNDG